MDCMNLIEKLARIRRMVDVISKDKQGFNYKYADIVEILAKVTAGMNKYKVSLIPMVTPATIAVTPITTSKVKFDKTGKSYEDKKTEMLVCADMVFKWVNEENLEDTLEVPWVVVGEQEDPSQAFGSGLTYCTRYFLSNYFQSAQDNDVDKFRSEQKAAEKKEESVIAEKIIETFDALVKGYIEEHKNKAEDVKKFVTKYVKNGNYFSIKDPTLASGLMEGFKNKFLTEGKESK